jgi:para-nitrobenzyl esterase
MKKIYSLLIAFIFLFCNASSTFSQCDGIRYHDSIFAYSLTSNVQYGSNLKTNYSFTPSNFNLMMDIYQPAGDVAPLRPLVIVAHGGSFISGSKTGTDVVPLCKDLAELGYVAASIEYRTGMTNFPISSTHTVDSTDAGAAVMRAVHDGRAAVRYFRKNARVGGNTYKIDTNNIYFAGVSAGGFIALHIAYMDLLSEFPAYVDTTAQPGLGGGLEGLSGNPGYSSNVKAIVNICGALGKTSWMQAGDEPVLSFHGTADQTVPYGTALIYLSPPSSYPLLVVDGSSSVANRANLLGIENCMVTWPGQGHVPQVGTSASAKAHYDSTRVITKQWLEHQLCGIPLNCEYEPVGILESVMDANLIVVYPNPASNFITIDMSALHHKTYEINIYDNLGKKVKNIKSVKEDKISVARESMKNGIYVISILSEGQTYTKKIILE